MDKILYLLVGLRFVWIDDKYFAIGSSEVHINGNITANAYSNDIKLKCLFTLGEGDFFFSIVLTAAENSTTDNFEEIAGYLRKNTFFTSFGMELFGNDANIHFEETKNTFMFVFNNLTCIHERRYKCVLVVVTSKISGIPRFFKSDAMWISVTVPPSKPEMNLPTKVNDLSGGKKNKRSATIMPKNDTREQDFIEGDNITFICEGDVGRPEGRFLWQKMYANDENLTYSNPITETTPESCSYDGNSTLTMQVTGDDNQATIRCIVKSDASQVQVYEDSEPLRIQFQVRTPVIELQPDKTVFLEGDSVLLKCQSQGNPCPSYLWLKGNESNGTIIAYTDSFVIENANITDSGLYTCFTNNSIDGNVYKAFNTTCINIAEKSTSPITSTLSPKGSDNRKDLHIAVISAVVAFFTLILFLIVVCICKKKQTSSKFSEYGLTMTNTKTKNDESKDTDNEAEQQQKDTYAYAGTEIMLTIDTYSKENPQNEDTYADAQDGVYDKSGDIRHIEEKDCELFDHVDTAKNSSVDRKNKETDNEFYQQQKDTYVYVETEIRQIKDTYSKDNPQNEDTYADAQDGVYDKSGDRRHIEEKDCELFDHVDTAKNVSAESYKPTESKDSTIMLNCYPKRPDQSKSCGYESVEMDGETPVLLSKSSGYEYSDANFIKQHNENYLQNHKEEDEKVKKIHGSQQHVEYAQVDETMKLKNKKKQTDKDQETVEIHEGTTFEFKERHAKTDVHDENFYEPKMRKSLTSVGDTIKQIDNINAEIQSGIVKRPGQTVDNAEYFDTTRHVQSLKSTEHTKQKENINAKTQEGIEERPGRVVDNAGYFDTTLRLMDQQSNGDQETAKRDDQTNTYTNQAFETEEDKIADEVSSQFRLLDGFQDGGERNQNVD